MQFEFNLNPFKRSSAGDFLKLTERQVPLVLVRNPRARRYVLRLLPNGSARVTIPRGGTIAEGRRFAERSAAWVERALQRAAARPIRTKVWWVGTEVYFRGELVRIENGGEGRIRLGSEVIPVKDETADLRREIEGHFWRLAAKELPPKVFEFAGMHQLTVARVTVRNQRSRWGSCSRRGTISLNWRIIHAPPLARDYLILHELMHLRQMNHSARFWSEVEAVCPDYRAAERWLKEHSNLLR